MKEIRCRKGKPFAESVTALRKKLKVAWQDVDVGTFSTDRRVNTDAARGRATGFCNCGRGVAKKTDIELGCFLRAEWRHEPGFDLSGAWRLRHYRQRTKIVSYHGVRSGIDNTMSRLHLAELFALSFSRKVRTDNAHLAKFGPLSMAIAGTNR